ncbi:uncharacterized protein EI97DRAFT_252783 [Westerdykella ornata]|uniref:Uncharacterized protein n=1 Tax=Westerdykella ornata TaxID=318751 RepID=A0A6A6JQ73_WESOR|nr:uncharacterized protein EI97DRAFT_252783 [Westerdykella ornata]KAF2278415.1 hypothetical protein EI97DRAFT_252783 [Westerdykella ornata]
MSLLALVHLRVLPRFPPAGVFLVHGGNEGKPVLQAFGRFQSSGLSAVQFACHVSSPDYWISTGIRVWRIRIPLLGKSSRLTRTRPLEASSCGLGSLLQIGSAEVRRSRPLQVAYAICSLSEAEHFKYQHYLKQSSMIHFFQSAGRATVEQTDLPERVNLDEHCVWRSLRHLATPS